MASHIHLAIDTIKGSSKDDGFEEQIDVESFSWSMDRPTSFSRGQGGAEGVVDVHHLAFTHYIDAASPPLMIACCTGEHPATATLTCSKAGGDSMDYYKIEMKNVVVAGVSPASISGDSIMETVQLAFAEFTVTQQDQDNAGKKGPEVSNGYNVQTHKKTK